VPAAPDREKALEMALAQIDKNFGKGSVMRLGDENRPAIAVIPTGSIALDVALGVGGLPRGRVVESPTHSVPAASQPSSTPSTRSTPTTPRSSASTPTSCSSASPTPVSRRSRSPTC
jgi:hypothetical protein